MILNYLASYTTYTSSATCTVNGHPASCKDAGGILAGFGVFMLLLGIYSLITFIFWIISLIHLIKHPDVNNRVLWIVIIFIIPFGSWIYFFGPRRSYNKSKIDGSGGPTVSINTGNQPQPPVAPVDPTGQTPPAESPVVVSVVTPSESAQSSPPTSAPVAPAGPVTSPPPTVEPAQDNGNQQPPAPV